MLELKDLTREEDIALMGLLKAVIQADKKLSPDENEELRVIAAALGPQRFHERVEEARGLFSTLSEMKAYAKTIERQPARQLIFNVVQGMAKRDELIPQEEELLEWLAALWQLEYFRK